MVSDGDVPSFNGDSRCGSEHDVGHDRCRRRGRPSLTAKSLGNRPNRIARTRAHRRGGPEHREEHDRVEDVDPLVPLQLKCHPVILTPIFRRLRQDVAEGFVDDTAVDLRPARIWVVRRAARPTCCGRDETDKSQREVEDRIQEGNYYQLDETVLVYYPICGQKLVHILPMDNKESDRQN